MRKFYLEYHADEKLSPLVREISWSHNVVIMDRCKEDLEKLSGFINTLSEPRVRYRLSKQE